MSIILNVRAKVRYWEDATVNGIEDKTGSLIPFRSGDFWCPRINVDFGEVLEWPKGITADVHYKVCDEGAYMIDAHGRQLIWQGDYVPDRFLCHGDRGYGDYIILNIDENGKIKNYVKPENTEGWR